MAEVTAQQIEFEHDDFDFEDIEQELEVDARCQSLLSCFYLHLQSSGMDVQAASDMAFCADYYLRDYLLDYLRQNVVRPKPGIIRYFAASWFITHTLDPEQAELERHLEAVLALYRFLYEQHFISADELEYLELEISRTDYYGQRIESFLAIRGDGYAAWEAECEKIV